MTTVKARSLTTIALFISSVHPEVKMWPIYKFIPWSAGGSFMAQKLAITSLIPAF